MREQGIVHIWHYLDDFFVAGMLGSNECMNALFTMLRICKILGIPLADEKVADPATTITILGIEFDTLQLVLRLPSEKLSHIKVLLTNWSSKKKCTKRELQSLIGQLQHASTVIKPGRTFLRRMYDLLGLVKQPHHHIHMNTEFRSDLAWWSLFLDSWNGSAMMSFSQLPSPTVFLTSDASGSWGCGAFAGPNWFQLAWPNDHARDCPIAYKELAPIVLALAIWGHLWSQQTVLCFTDNTAVVSILLSRTSKNKDIMHLVRCLYFYEAHFQCFLTAQYLPGSHNELADHLSRNRLCSFLQKRPQARQSPSVIPPALLNLLFLSKPDWLSREWRELFGASSTRP